jgi:hypothetical protein
MTRAVEYSLESSFKTKLPQDNNGNISLDFIKAPIGERFTSEVWVRNVAMDTVQLIGPYTTDERFKIDSFPTVLGIKGVGKIELVFDDPKQTLKGINAGWGFKEVIIG